MRVSADSFLNLGRHNSMKPRLYLIMLPDYLNGKEIPDCVDSKDVSGTKHHRE